MLTSSSNLLLTHMIQPIRKVIVLLPKTFKSTAIFNKTKVQLLREDILLSERDPVFQSSPFSIQFAGCGRRGRCINLPVDGLLTSKEVSEAEGKVIDRRKLLCVSCVS